jgi:hypothetical protein
MFFSFGFSDFQDIFVLFYGFKIMPISKCVKREDLYFLVDPVFKNSKKNCIMFLHS